MDSEEKKKGFFGRHIPIISWLPEYNLEKAISDLIAGITVGLTVIPQGLAYATLAGLPPQYGLYSSFMGCLVYMVLGSCKDITIGPTALMALMTYQQIVGRNADFAILLCFLTGCIQVLMGIFHLGVLIDFISIPVTVGFTSATSVIIAVSQLKGLLGLSFSSSGFMDTLKKVAANVHNAKFTDSFLGFTCIVVLLILRKLKDFKVTLSEKNKEEIINKSAWLLSTSRNALIVVFCSSLAYIFDKNGSTPFVLTGPVKPGLPSIQPPPITTILNNQTLSFIEMCSELGSSIVMVPVIGVLGNIAIAKAFSSGDSIDATQELLTLGVSNMLGSFVSSMPVTGSFSRSAVNHASGVKTPLGGLYTGLLIILALWQLTPYFYYIPKASLAAVIICAVIFMIEYEVVKPMWRSSRKDLIPTIATFLLCLCIGVEYGILIGVCVNIILLLYPSARPSLQVEKTLSSSGEEYLLVIPDNSLYFPAVDFLRSQIGKVGVKLGSRQLPVVIDCRYILGADFTAAKGIAGLIQDFKQRKQPLYFYNPRPSVLALLKGVCLDDFVHVLTQQELDHILQETVLKKNTCNAIDKSVVAVEMEMKGDCQRRRNASDQDSKGGCDQPLLEQTEKSTRTPIIRPSY
ncbi:sodium-independent sulfate anion transporter isoform X2 [Lycorma delicatula]